jgi:hypothetical protein
MKKERPGTDVVDSAAEGGNDTHVPSIQTSSDWSLDKIENGLRKEYSRRRRICDPSYRMTPAVAEAMVWDRAARLVKKHGADPIEWIDAQFSATPGTFPQVSQLSSTRAEKNYLERFHGSAGEANRKERESYDEKIMHLQLQRLQVKASMGVNFEDELCDPQRDYTPLFRILYCPEKRLPEIIDRWGRAAKESLRRSNGLRKYISTLKETSYDRYKRVILNGFPV